MIGALLKPELIKMIDERDSVGLREALSEFPVAEIAEIFEEFEDERKAVMVRTLPDELAADLFEYLDQDEREKLADALKTEELVGILDEVDPDDRTDFLEDLEEEDAEELVSKLRPEEREMAEQLLDYPEDSIGRIMTPEFVAIEDDWTGGHVGTRCTRCSSPTPRGNCWVAWSWRTR
jgi:magnesium transporter